MTSDVKHADSCVVLRDTSLDRSGTHQRGSSLTRHMSYIELTSCHICSYSLCSYIGTLGEYCCIYGVFCMLTCR